MSKLLQDDEYEHEETVFYKAAFHCFDWNHSGRIATSVSWSSSFIPQPFCLSYISGPAVCPKKSWAKPNRI